MYVYMVEAITVPVVFISMMCMCIYAWKQSQSVRWCSIYIYDVYVYIWWKQSQSVGDVVFISMMCMCIYATMEAITVCGGTL